MYFWLFAISVAISFCVFLCSSLFSISRRICALFRLRVFLSASLVEPLNVTRTIDPNMPRIAMVMSISVKVNPFFLGIFVIRVF